MDTASETARPALNTYEGLAKMIDHSLLRPELTEEQVLEGCGLAIRYNVATVTVRPCDVDMAVRQVQGTGVAVSTVAGFPHGDTTTAVKLYEVRDLLRRGAIEIDMVLNISKLISRQFQYVETEIRQAAEACHEKGALLKVIFENAYLNDELKIVACRICTRAEADFVKTSTGFAPTGATLEDLKLMRAHSGAKVQVKAAGGVRTMEKALEVYEVGCTRFGATTTAAILDNWKQHLAKLQNADSAPAQA
jgi:deoxyribose-phosphate aldolase